MATAPPSSACNDGSIEQFFIKPFSPIALQGAVLGLMRARGRLSRPRVLVADDDPNVRALIRGFLERKGIESVDADGGKVATRLFDAGGLEAALVDIGMPDVNGLGVLEHIVARDPGFPVIMLTGGDASIGLSLIVIASAIISLSPEISHCTPPSVNNTSGWSNGKNSAV
jgi:hypothetical protein